MENHLAQDTDVSYTSILTMKATVSGVKNVEQNVAKANTLLYWILMSSFPKATSMR